MERSALFKAESFGDLAEDAGWEVEFDSAGDHDVSVHAYRNGNAECVAMRWIASKRGSKLEFGQYSNGGYTLSIPNIATAIARIEGNPLTKPSRSRRSTQDEEADSLPGWDFRILPITLPFDFCSAYDDEIIDAVRGKKITWWGEETTAYYSSMVWPERQRGIFISESGRNGEAILNFLSPEGFRAAYIKCIIQVK